MKTYEVHEKIKLGNKKSICFKYIGEVTASSASEAKNKVIVELPFLSVSRLNVKLK